MLGKGVALGGFMGVGKTTVGRLLASTLDWPFADLDDELERRFGAIPEQWALVGEAGFRLREREVLRDFCDGHRRVFATGGGTWISAENRALLADAYERCVLQASIETIRIRINASGSRPLLHRWEALWQERERAYSDADFFVFAEVEPAVVVDRIVAAIRKRGLV